MIRPIIQGNANNQPVIFDLLKKLLFLVNTNGCVSVADLVNCATLITLSHFKQKQGEKGSP